MRKLIQGITVFFAAVILLTAISIFRFVCCGQGKASETVTFELPSGLPMAKVAARLKSMGLISDDFKFRVFAKLTGQERRLRKGEYLLNRGMTPQEIIDTLASGKSIQYPITFPEGSNIYDMAQVLETKGLYKGQDFLKLVREPELVKKVTGMAAPSLEGYLFPETYSVTKFTTLRELVHVMISRFNENYKTLEAASTLRMSRHDVVTLASVVEKETGAPEERPLIASVFYNRLKIGMPLQSDPTILYGIIDETGHPTNNITKADILHPNRYNTYTVKRLPYGPIANPGKAALAAVLNPAVSEYLYFVSKNDGTHTFSTTYSEHLKGVKTFQMDPAAREGKSWRDLKKRTASGEALPK